MRDFVYVGLPVRVVFGAGSIAGLSAELERLGAMRALVLCTPGRGASVKAVAAGLGARLAGVYDKARMHTPVEIAEDARRVASEIAADCLVSVGGGSTTGLGKAVALTSGLPLVAVPTTYAGSEMTTIYGMAQGGVKKTGRDPRVVPRTVLYDPDLTLGLPAGVSAASGMNAIAHCAEALYAHDGNPIVSLMAEEGIRALAAALPAIVRDPADRAARGEALYGAWLAGMTIATTSIALHHKLCHVLGGAFDLPHAETHSIVLPHALAYNRGAAPEAMARIARALSASRGRPVEAADAPGAMYDLESGLGLPMRLADLGVPEDGLERAAKSAVEAPYPNPSPVGYEGVLELLREAYAGRRPVPAR